MEILNFYQKGIHIIDSAPMRHSLISNSPEETESFDENPAFPEPVVANFSIRHFLRDLSRPSIQEETQPLPPEPALHPIKEQPLADSAIELGEFSKYKNPLSPLGRHQRNLHSRK